MTYNENQRQSLWEPRASRFTSMGPCRAKRIFASSSSSRGASTTFSLAAMKTVLLFDPSTKYEAISYVWGTDVMDHLISFDVRNLPITKNLDASRLGFQAGMSEATLSLYSTR